MSEIVTIRKLADVEAEHIQSALDLLAGNMTRAAAALGISRRTLYRKAEALGIKQTRVSELDRLRNRVAELERGAR